MKSFIQYITELASVSDLLNKKGNEFLNKVLNKNVVVNLKIDQAAFVLSKKAGEISYLGREGGKKIDLIKRLGMDVFEKPISHIEGLGDKALEKLPDNIEVYMEFFDAKFPTLIQYKRHPKNDLIISYIKQGGKTVTPNHPLNKKVADILKVSPPPVLFDGKLSAKQKKDLIEFSNTPEDDRLEKYGYKKFVSFILSMFVLPDEVKYLETDQFEGLVFFFGDKDQVMAKVVDPGFTQGIKDKQAKNAGNEYQNNVNDIIHKYFDKAVKKAISAKPNDYIDFVVELTVAYVKMSKKTFKKFDKKTIDKTRFSRISFTLLPRQVTAIVKKDWWAEDVFRALLFLFQAEKKRANPGTGLTKVNKEKVNKVIADLRKIGISNN